MTNALDYLHWRGDLSFSQDPPNAIDALIFSVLVYTRFPGIAKTEPDTAIPLRQATEDFLQLENHKDLLTPHNLALLKAASETNRFGSIRLVHYQDEFIPEEDTQFAAMTFLLDDGTAMLAFRGTDNTLVGWKEDFNMCFSQSVPAQRLALEYTAAVYTCHHCPLRLCGHSKGGNLAMYAAAKSEPHVRDAILDVYNNDGPGFSEYMINDPGYLEMVPRIHTYVPQSSIIGLLMEHAEPYQIIKSDQVSILQHDIYSWEVSGKELIPVEELTSDARFVSATIKKWLFSMDMDARNQMVDALFKLLTYGNVERAVDIFQPKNVRRYMMLIGTDENIRRILTGEFMNLLDAARNKQKPQTALPEADETE